MSSDLQTYQNQVAELYIVFFGRAPEAEGMNHWVQALSNGATIHDLAVGFSKSDEYQSHYGDLSASEAIRRFYQNALDRAADPRGLDYWLNKIDQGHTFYEVAVGKIEAAFAGGDDVDTNDTAIVRNKVEVAKYVALTLASNDQQLVDGALDGVTTDPSQVLRVKAALTNMSISLPQHIEGTAGSDTLIGGSSNDRIIGHAGADVLIGNEGADTFRFEPGDSGTTLESADVIIDFNADEDRLTSDLSFWGPGSPFEIMERFVWIEETGPESFYELESRVNEVFSKGFDDPRAEKIPYIYVVPNAADSGDTWVILNREDHRSFGGNDSLIILRGVGEDYEISPLNFFGF
ncbi:DUF4214 domain-containing protein [Orrella daihaiensis]|uniref:DUF4214 domain-containing protein n=1 Tax=Orrella daihaiensis TaxID=2782176 RepID=A0ABY4AK95_9BURK|nr:DUF4214 domain-containing protein [Orrella daihaiensis]UOD50388.1 DUF4214 domain-containing protein [Orrella daihaiensis]